MKNHDGEYVVLTGNQTGALLLHYLLSQKKKNGTLPETSVILKTIVTSEFGRAIADDFKVKSLNTLTGFKFIAEKFTIIIKQATIRFNLATKKAMAI